MLREDTRHREILIGRSTYVDTRAGVRIVDWRDAPGMGNRSTLSQRSLGTTHSGREQFSYGT